MGMSRFRFAADKSVALASAPTGALALSQLDRALWAPELLQDCAAEMEMAARRFRRMEGAESFARSGGKTELDSRAASQPASWHPSPPGQSCAV